MMKVDGLLRRWYWLVAMLAPVLICGAIFSPIPGPGGHLSPHPSPTSACIGVKLTVASNVQAVIDNAPPGTTFCFSPGTYRVSSLVPKSGDILDGGGQRAVM